MYWKVQVLRDGRPVRGKKVTTYRDSFWSGGSLEAYTDDDGIAEFGFEGAEPAHRAICVDGEKLAEPYIEDGDCYTVNLD